MEIYSVRDLSFTYPGADKPALDKISFTVNEGEFITVCGLSGSGKSTLLRHLKTALRPYGRTSGEVLYYSEKIDDVNEMTQAKEIGFVMQSPDDQTVTDKVRQELAFGLENIGLSSEIIRRRVAETSSFFGLDKILDRRLCELSGGQRQILNLASVMILQPKAVILDEPVSQLDPSSAEKFMQLLISVNRELGTTVILCEHDLERIFSVSSRILVMSDGKLLSDEHPCRSAGFINNSSPELLGALPASARIYSYSRGSAEGTPLDISSGRQWLSSKVKGKAICHNGTSDTEKIQPVKKPVIELKNLYYRYDKREADIISGLSLTACEGEIISILGGNGSGKTTLLNIITGQYKPYSGKCKTIKDKKIALLPQDPKALFVCDTVMSELTEMLPDRRNNSMLRSVIDLCGLDGLSEHHPYDLSGGEQQKLALAKLILYRPDILLLDEPVKGTDCRAKAEIGSILRFLAEKGICIILVSHDMDFCAQFSDKCAMLHDGALLGNEVPVDFFCGNAFYTTAARRMSSGIIPDAVTDSDILRYLGINVTSSDDIDRNKLRKIFEPEQNDPEPVLEKTGSKNEKIRISRLSHSGKAEIISLLSVFAAVPLTIFIGIYFFGDARYLFISLLILLECMLPFFALFEKKHIRTRELVLISVMCAICITARAVFYGLPQFKPVTALVIISGAALGCESGFLVGAVSMLLSNMIFGQGPWTPWQMFAMGLIGFLSGLIFERNNIPHNRISFSIFGFFSALIIYGGIMDPAAMIMSHIEPTWENIRIYYLSGLPLDMIHAVSTAVFLFIASMPFIKKLERVKHKYGLIVSSE